MYTLSLISVNESIQHSIPMLSAFLQELPIHKKYQLNINDDFEPKGLIESDINFFFISGQTLSNSTYKEKIKIFLKKQEKSINICLLVDNFVIENEITLLFHDFIFWPCNSFELKTRVSRFLIQKEQPKEENINQLLVEFSKLNLIGRSPSFLKNVTLIKKVAQCHAPVLIYGETGTGKENAARAIHYLSNRSENSFVPVNCAAIPETLIESELFGHEKGAFTDAKNSQEGLISVAKHGTLFLDEVDSLSAKAQAVLLRFLQTQEYRALGGRQLQQADVRIVVATNADLRSKVLDKTFREDLYFRLNVLNVNMPPLRERLQDIPLLCESFLERFALEYETNLKKISMVDIQNMQQQDWPGNIRELENTLLREFLLSPGEYLDFGEHLGFGMHLECENNLEPGEHFDYQENSHEESKTQKSLATSEGLTSNMAINTLPLNFHDAKSIVINEFETNYLKNIMKISQGNVSQAARMAGKERRSLGKLLQKYAIDKMQFS